MSIFFRIIADLHYMDEIPNWPDKRKLVEYAEPILDKIIELTNNNEKIKFIINLGDLIQSKNNKENDQKNLKYVVSKLKAIKIPVYHILGNHELKSVKSNKEVLSILEYSNTSYSFNIEDYHFLIIGTDINKKDVKFKAQYVSKEDMLWIEKDLEKNKNKKIIIFCHFGIIEDKDIMNNYWAYTDNGENLMLRNRVNLLNVLSKYNIIGMFCGHQHWTKELHYKNINCYMLGSLTENINNDGIPDGVYFDVRLEDNKMIVEEKHINIE